MRTFLILLSVFAVGCGVQGVSHEATWPSGHAKSDGSVTPFGSSTTSEMGEASDYRVCLAQNEGLPGAAEACTAKIMAGMPGHLPVCGYGFGVYDIPGRTCRMPMELAAKKP